MISCIDYDGCDFWTFRAGWERDCYLKRDDDDDDDGMNRVKPLLST